jgi:hypothetical protein
LNAGLDFQTEVIDIDSRLVSYSNDKLTQPERNEAIEERAPVVQETILGWIF